MITKNRVMTETSRLMQSNPKKITRKWYTNQDGSPQCLVAHVLKALDLKYPKYRTKANTTKISSFVFLRKIIDRDGMKFLSQIQKFQDSGMTWRESYYSAKETS